MYLKEIKETIFEQATTNLMTYELMKYYNHYTLEDIKLQKARLETICKLIKATELDEEYEDWKRVHKPTIYKCKL